MNKLIACEVGNFDTKLMARDPEISKWAVLNGLKENSEDEKADITKIAVFNMVCRGKDRRSLDKRKSLLNSLDVTIKSASIPDEERWFVGGLAFTEGENIIKPTREDKKSENITTMVQILTTLALSLYDPQKPCKTEEIVLGTLLPTEEYFTKGTSKRFLDKLLGTHAVKFNDPIFNGGEITLNIKDVDLLPEGTAGSIAITYDWDGNSLIDNIEEKTIMNIDIGSIDTDFSILANGEYMDKGFFGIKGGTTKVLREISNEINEKYGHKFDTHKIDYHIRTEKPLTIGNTIITDLIEIAEKKYKYHARLLSNEITEEMLDRNIYKDEINIVNIFGGGTRFFEKGFKEHFRSEHMEFRIPKDPRFTNAEGSLKSVIMKVRESDPSGDEVFAGE